MRGQATIATPPTAEVEISLLGPRRARRGGEELHLGGPRQRAVLARWALGEGEAVARERDRMLVSGLGAASLGPVTRELELVRAGAGRLGVAVRIAPHPSPP